MYTRYAATAINTAKDGWIFELLEKENMELFRSSNVLKLSSNFPCETKQESNQSWKAADQQNPVVQLQRLGLT